MSDLFGFLMAIASASPAARGQRHRMNHEGGSVVIQQVNHLNDSPAQASSNNQPLLPIALSRKPAPGVAHDRLDFADRAAVPGRVGQIPVDPPELFW
jgi:hypothetical protein